MVRQQAEGHFGRISSVGGDDLYGILGVSRSATADEIKKRYRKLARELHPDRNPSKKGADQFKKVSAAFAVLGDAKKRKLYDEFGPDGLREGFDAQSARHFKNFGGFGAPGGMGGFGGMGGMGGLGGFGDLEDLLGGLFGGAARGPRQRQRPQRGRDRVVTAHLSIEDLLEGAELNLSGAGRVKVPSGVYDGQKMRIAGKGEPGPAGAGDLLIELKAEVPSGYERQGHDLVAELPLRISQAVLGCDQEVRLPGGGSIKLRVPPRSQSGQRLRVKERGVPVKGGRGHLYLVLKVMMPTVEDEQLSNLVKELDAFYS